MAEKNLLGNCPYCKLSNLVDEVEQTDPRRTYQKCGDCGKYSAEGRNGTQYPLVDPDDVRSSVAIRTQ